MKIKQYILGKNYSTLEPYFGKFSTEIGELLFENLKGNLDNILYQNNINILFQERKAILEVLKISHIEQILVYSTRGKLEVLSLKLIFILLEHNKTIFKILKSLQDKTLLSFPLLGLYDGEAIHNLIIKFYISIKNGDTTVFGAYNISFSIGNTEIFVASFYISNDRLFLANMQYLKGAKEYFDLIKYHRVVFYVLQYLASSMNLQMVESYSNFLHPSKFGKEHNGFKGNYDSLAKSIGMVLNEDGFFGGDILKASIKLPIIHKKTIAHHIDKLLDYF